MRILLRPGLVGVVLLLAMPAVGAEAEGCGDKSVEELLGDLDTFDRSVRDPAIERLSNSGTAVVPALSALAADKSKSDHARWGAVLVLARIKDPSTKPLLIRCLKDDYGAVRGSASWGLSQIGGKDVADPLLEYLRVSLEKERWGDVVRATEAQRELPDQRAIPLLIKCLDAGRDPYAYVAQALGKLGDPRASESLAKRLNVKQDYSDSRDHRYLTAIAQTKGWKAAPYLVEYLKALVKKMEGQDPSLITGMIGARNRQLSYNFGLYRQKVATLELLAERKSPGGTREEVAQFWEKWLREDFPSSSRQESGSSTSP